MYRMFTKVFYNTDCYDLNGVRGSLVEIVNAGATRDESVSTKE